MLECLSALNGKHFSKINQLRLGGTSGYRMFDDVKGIYCMYIPTLVRYTILYNITLSKVQ